MLFAIAGITLIVDDDDDAEFFKLNQTFIILHQFVCLQKLGPIYRVRIHNLGSEVLPCYFFLFNVLSGVNCAASSGPTTNFKVRGKTCYNF